MQPVGSLAEAWDLVRRDLATHASGEAVYLRSGLSEAGPLDSVGITAAEAARTERVTVGVRGGLAVGGGVPRAETPDALATALAGIADLVQDVVEESFHEAWPQCPCHARRRRSRCSTEWCCGAAGPATGPCASASSPGER
jgi:hypothetical protein